MSRIFSLAFLAAVLLTAGCQRPEDTSGDAEKLQEEIDRLVEQRRKSEERRDAGLSRELAEAREDLQMALAALQALEAREGEGAEAPDDGENVNVEGAARAEVVEEGPAADLALGAEFGEPAAAVLDAQDHQVFFAELSKFGEWFETEEFGFVWQPGEVRTNPAWRPYTRGRWVQSDQGWTWLSDEPFGWAVYHYGRWALLETHGWVWIPGDDWAPAWVAWRQNDDLIGWAPLPPETLYDEVFDYDAGIDVAFDISSDCYSFVPVRFFYEPIFPRCVPRISVPDCFRRTRNVTRFWTRDQRVHCGGPDFAWVNRHCLRPVPPCRLDLAGGRDRFANRHLHHLRGDRLEIFAPRVDAAWNAAVCPTRVSRNLGRVNVVRGKGRLDEGVRQGFERAVVQRHENAREALRTAEGDKALRTNLERRRQAEQGERIADLERAKVDVAVREALAKAEATERQLREAGLDPKARASAQLTARKAERQLQEARQAFEQEQGRRGRRASVVERREPVEGRDDAGGVNRPVAQEARSGADAKAIALEERRRIEAEAEKAETVRRSDAQRREQAAAAALAAQREKDRAVAEERTKAEREVMRRAEDERAQREEQGRREAALRRSQDEAEAEAEEDARRARQAELAREKARQEQIAQQRAVAESQRRAADAKRRAEEDAARRAAAAREKQLAMQVQRQRAEESRRQLEARQQAQEAQRRAAAIQQARDAQRRAAEDANRRAMQERAQAEAAAKQRAQQESQRRADQQRAQAEAAAKQRAQQESQRRADQQRAQQESQRRAAEAQRKAESARRQHSPKRRK